MGGLELGERHVTPMARIDVEHDAPGGRCPDVGAGKLRPPLPNGGGVGARVLEPVKHNLANGMLACVLALCRAAGAAAGHRPPDRKDRHAVLDVVQRRVEHRARRRTGYHAADRRALTQALVNRAPRSHSLPSPRRASPSSRVITNASTNRLIAAFQGHPVAVRASSTTARIERAMSRVPSRHAALGREPVVMGAALGRPARLE